MALTQILVAVVQEGKDLLPRCDLCVMHMPPYRKTARCDRNTHMRWRRRGMTITSKSSDATFSLTGEDEAECIEGVGRFKYLGRLLDRSDNDWPEVLHNIRKSRQVWRQLGELLQREGAEPTVLKNIYRAVVQAVLLFGAETWVLTERMFRLLEGMHMSFLRQSTRKQATRRRYGSWRQALAEAVLREAGTHTLRTYVARR